MFPTVHPIPLILLLCGSDSVLLIPLNQLLYGSDSAPDSSQPALYGSDSAPDSSQPASLWF